MTALKKIAGPRTFLLVGDSKLISYTNAAAMAAGQVAFVAPLAAARVPAGLFAALPPGAGTGVDYVAGRDAGKPAAARGTHRVLEDDGMDIRGSRKSDPVVHLRRILVYSSANAAGQAKARALKLAKAAAELDKLVRTAGTRFHPTEDAVAARVQAIAAERRAGKYLRTAITAGQAGKPVLAWHCRGISPDGRLEVLGKLEVRGHRAGPVNGDHAGGGHIARGCLGFLHPVGRAGRRGFRPRGHPPRPGGLRESQDRPAPLRRPSESVNELRPRGGRSLSGESVMGWCSGWATQTSVPSEQLNRPNLADESLKR
jgi:hypothetical protein